MHPRLLIEVNGHRTTKFDHCEGGLGNTSDKDTET